MDLLSILRHGLWKELDELEVDDLDIISKVNLYEQIIKASSDKDEIRSAELEKKSLYFILIMHHQFSHLEAFKKDAIMAEIEQFVHDDHDRQALHYYGERHNSSLNVFDKWRYAFVLWVLSKDFTFLDKAICHLFDCTIKRLQEQNYIQSVFLLVKIFNIVRLYNVFSKSKGTRDRLIAQALELIDRVYNTSHARWMIEPSEIIGLINNSVSAQKAGDLISRLHNQANEFRKKNDFHLHRSLLEASIGLCALLDLSTSEKNELKKNFHMMIAQSHVEEGKSRLLLEGAIVATMCYQNAITEYRKVNAQSKIDELNQMIRGLGSKAIEEMDEIETKIELPKLQFHSSNQYDLVKEIIAYTRASMPTAEILSENVRNSLENNPLSMAAATITFNEKNPVSYNVGDESIIDCHIVRELNWRIQIIDYYIASTILELEDTKKITVEAYRQFLSDCSLLDDDTFRLIIHGIQMHFSKDYVSSIHILTPQIEATLRTLLNLKGVNTLRTKGDTIIDNELGGLLGKPATKTLLGRNFTTYMKMKLVEQEGTNLRNQMSHGILSYNRFIHSESLAIIRTILALCELAIH